VKKFVKNSIIVLVGVVTAMILVEFVLQVSDKTSYDGFFYDQKTGLLLHQLNSDHNISSTCFENNVHINSLGFYGPEISLEKPTNEYRIVITGSSFVESLQIPLSERFDALLEKKLNENSKSKTFKVISVGFAGNGTFLDMLYFKNYASKLKPDLTINLITDYDLKIDSPESNHVSYFDENGEVVTELPSLRRNPTKLYIQGIMRKSKLVMNIYYKLLTFKETRKKTVQKSDTGSQINLEESWKVEDKLLDSFNKMVKENNSKFLLVSWTQDGVADRKLMSESLQPISTKNKINYFDLTPTIDNLEKKTGIKPTWECDGHWNEEGHVWVADALFEYLKSNPISL